MSSSCRWPSSFSGWGWFENSSSLALRLRDCSWFVCVCVAVQYEDKESKRIHVRRYQMKLPFYHDDVPRSSDRHYTTDDGSVSTPELDLPSDSQSVPSARAFSTALLSVQKKLSEAFVMKCRISIINWLNFELCLPKGATRDCAPASRIAVDATGMWIISLQMPWLRNIVYKANLLLFDLIYFPV